MKLGYKLIALLVLWFVLVGGLYYAAAQEYSSHPPQDQATHEKFYSNWMRPDNRQLSCCSMHDCYPTEFKSVGGTWFALRREDGAWIPIPAGKLEQDRDNPDGRNHVCMQSPGSADMVFCAILGGGT